MIVGIYDKFLIYSYYYLWSGVPQKHKRRSMRDRLGLRFYFDLNFFILTFPRSGNENSPKSTKRSVLMQKECLNTGSQVCSDYTAMCEIQCEI